MPARARIVSCETEDRQVILEVKSQNSDFFQVSFALSENRTCINYAITGFPQILKAI